MTTTKNLGIWLDHSNAHIIEYKDDSIESRNVESTFTHEEKVNSLGKSENIMHNKENQLQGAYYKQLGEIIKNYDEVILFGPTDAKVELFNLLKEDHQFAKVKMEVKTTEKMTEHQEQAFVREHFSKS